MRTWLPLIIAHGLLFGPGRSDVAAQSSCQVCADCGGAEHRNDPDGIIGNDDPAHLFCHAYSCYYMGEHGVHVANCYAGFAAAAFDDATTSDQKLTSAEARDLLALFPEHVAWDPTGRYLQVLDCHGDAVVRQAAVSFSRKEVIVAAVTAWFRGDEEASVLGVVAGR